MRSLGYTYTSRLPKISGDRLHQECHRGHQSGRPNLGSGQHRASRRMLGRDETSWPFCVPIWVSPFRFPQRWRRSLEVDSQAFHLRHCIPISSPREKLGKPPERCLLRKGDEIVLTVMDRPSSGSVQVPVRSPARRVFRICRRGESLEKLSVTSARCLLHGIDM